MIKPVKAEVEEAKIPPVSSADELTVPAEVRLPTLSKPETLASP